MEKNRFRQLCLIINLLLTLSFGFSLSGCANQSQNNTKPIGIAWSDQMDSEVFTNITNSLDSLNISYIVLDQVVMKDLCDEKGNLKAECIDSNGILTEAAATKVKNAKENETNLVKATEKVSGVIFSGGSDISPSLYAVPQAWHGIEFEKDYNALRDVSDYLLMDYCLEKDIPILGICRGMQMLGVVSGATMIQDIPTYFQSQGVKYNHSHRPDLTDPNAVLECVAHDVTITEQNSIVGKIIEKEKIENVPSWQHQAVLSVDNTPLKATGVTDTSGIQMIEVIERTDQSYAVGYQFHLEVVITKKLTNAKNLRDYMNPEEAENIFLNFSGFCTRKGSK